MSVQDLPTYIVRVTTDESLATLLAAMLDDWNLCVFLPRNESATEARLECYCASREEAEARCGILRSLLARRSGAPADCLTIQAMQNEDWAESWKTHFHVRRVSERIIVRPPWESYTPAPGECVLVMEPGLSFGTGEHETTQACLRILDELQRVAPTAAVLDIGCGTGVLAIAAAKLGFPRIMALDNDPVATRVACANADLNGVAGRIEIHQADIRTWCPDVSGDFNIVLANLLSELLIENAEHIISAVAAGPDSRLVLSGILTSQYAGVRMAYAARGFHEVRALALNDWTTGCFQRNKD